MATAKAFGVLVAVLSLAAEARSCRDGAESCLARDSVLLQHPRARLTPAAAMLQRSGLTCDACVETFAGLGGCAVLHGQRSAADAARLHEILDLPQLAGCQELPCQDRLRERCVSLGFSGDVDDGNNMPPAKGPAAAPCPGSCASAMVASGVCDAMRSSDVARIEELMSGVELAACLSDSCGEVAMRNCFPELADSSCSRCVAEFDEAGGCEVLRGGTEDPTKYIPEGCFLCGEDAMVHCLGVQPPDEEEDEGKESEEDDMEGQEQPLRPVPDAGCHTAREGEECFMHVRWAMQTGVEAHPEWYPGVTAESRFEEFQTLLHSGDQHHCRMPCAPVRSDCHDAVPGETCHSHVEWAMNTGITTIPTWYPTLTKDSSFGAFQALLHHLRHGDCPEPCSAAESDDDAAIKPTGKPTGKPTPTGKPSPTGKPKPTPTSKPTGNSTAEPTTTTAETTTTTAAPAAGTY